MQHLANRCHNRCRLGRRLVAEMVVQMLQLVEANCHRQLLRMRLANVKSQPYDTNYTRDTEFNVRNAKTVVHLIKKFQYHTSENVN